MRPRALVTGGSAGLGQALVRRLQAAGYDVVAVDRVAPSDDDGALSILCDLADRDEVDRNLDAIMAGGPYHAVFLNAGVSATGRFEAIPVEAYRRLVAVNTETPMLMAAALVRAGAVTGHICFVASLSHFTGYPGAAVYAASKDALAVYARSVRKPFARRGIKVTVAFPGLLRTEHAARHAPAGSDARRRTTPDAAARGIVAATFAGRRSVYSGPQSRAIALFGRFFPERIGRAMRGRIFDRLDKDVW